MLSILTKVNWQGEYSRSNKSCYEMTGEDKAITCSSFN